MREIWPFKVAHALKTAAVVKVLRGLGDLPKKSIFWKFLRAIAQRCMLKVIKNTIRRSGLSSHSQESQLLAKRVSGWCG